MKSNSVTNLLLFLIVVLLSVIATRSLRTPETVHAQAASAYPFYFEPGTYMLRAPDGSSQVYGKVAVDLRTGKIWGFPTLGPQPFPVNMIDNKPQTSRPFAMGRFAFEDTDK
jgi:hypothetical protein